jgi:hypothetical protein
MVTIDIKKLLRDERQKRITPTTTVAQEESDELPACSLERKIDLASFAVGVDELSVGRALSAVRHGHSHPHFDAVSSTAPVNTVSVQGLFYIPDALTRQEEHAILEGIDAVPASRYACMIQSWTRRKL